METNKQIELDKLKEQYEFEVELFREIMSFAKREVSEKDLEELLPRFMLAVQTIMMDGDKEDLAVILVCDPELVNLTWTNINLSKIQLILDERDYVSDAELLWMCKQIVIGKAISTTGFRKDKKDFIEGFSNYANDNLAVDEEDVEKVKELYDFMCKIASSVRPNVDFKEKFKGD